MSLARRNQFHVVATASGHIHMLLSCTQPLGGDEAVNDPMYHCTTVSAQPNGERSMTFAASYFSQWLVFLFRFIWFIFRIRKCNNNQYCSRHMA